MKYDINDENWTMFNRYELSGYPKYLVMYDREYDKLCSLYPDIDLPYGKSISELYYILEYSESANESTYLFPGDKVYFYPMVEVLKARKMHTC